MGKRFGRVAIIGVGLIGGSIGLALKSRRLAKEIVGVGHHAKSIKKALSLKTIDRGTLSLKDGVKDADIIIFATPVLTILRLSARLKELVRTGHLKTGCIITDVGSVKTKIVGKMEGFLPKGINFVGAHPMAGSEKRGVEIARADLFRRSVCILTKTRKTPTSSLSRIKRLWKDLGASVVVLSPEIHDKFVSQISHLPHMVVFALLNSVEGESLKFASTGFFDTTRIASSDAKVWKDIALSNKHELLKSLGKFRRRLSALEGAIRRKDSKRLLHMFKAAREKRQSV